MKKILLTIVCMFSCVVMLFSQAKKPKLMIIPSRTWCIQNDFISTYTDMSGVTQRVPDFQKAFDENADISMVIGAMQDFMINEGYKVEDLKGALARIKNREARDNMTTAGGGLSQSPIDVLNRTAKADINVELFYAIKKDGPYKYIEFNVSAIDAYSNTPISTGNIGRGTSSTSANLVLQLEEAVLSFKDKFIADMDKYYARLFENGRQIVIRCSLAETCAVTYEDEYEGEELSQLIENWISDHSMKGNYSLSNKTENEVFFDDIRIPMTYIDKNGNTKGTDANWFARDLRKYLELTTGCKCKVDFIGLSEVNIILGGKM